MQEKEEKEKDRETEQIYAPMRISSSSHHTTNFTSGPSSIFPSSSGISSGSGSSSDPKITKVSSEVPKLLEEELLTASDSNENIWEDKNNSENKSDHNDNDIDNINIDNNDSERTEDIEPTDDNARESLLFTSQTLGQYPFQPSEINNLQTISAKKNNNDKNSNNNNNNNNDDDDDDKDRK